jgi:alpha-L-rhamnosidase
LSEHAPFDIFSTPVMSLAIDRVTFEHYQPGQAVGLACPRISWRFRGDSKNWHQRAYDIQIHRSGISRPFHVVSSQSVLVPWPDAPLRSREKATIEVTVTGEDATAVPKATLDIEVALLNREDWSAKVITGPPEVDGGRTPFLLRKRFRLSTTGAARLYITSLGVYEAEINGKTVGDHVLAPGWQSYNYRHSYQTFDVSDILQEGENEIVATLADGWYAGRLGWEGGRRGIYGSRLGLLAQLEVDGQLLVGTEGSWEWTTGSLISSELYDGEHIDTRKPPGPWIPVELLPFPTGRLIVPQAPPVRRIQKVEAVDIFTTPSGKTIIDFGQNLVGRLRWNKQIDGPGVVVTIRHAEVMEHGELGVRPLRICKATDKVVLGGQTMGYEPKFTFHGFRYAQIEGFPRNVQLDDFTAVVVHNDMERTGEFDSSHKLINQLHSNVTWGMRGNFVSVPTDCPQRDERLGWTGDLAAFSTTASFLYDVAGTLAEWLHDLSFEQLDFGKGVPPTVVPSIFADHPLLSTQAFAIWGDVATITPYDLFRAYGDEKILIDQYESMIAWLDRGVRRAPTGLWDPENHQLGDWLDPRAPPDSPGAGQTDRWLVADAFLIRSTHLVAKSSGKLGYHDAAKRYDEDARRLLEAFHAEYVTANSRLMSDSQCAYVLALWFNLATSAEQAQKWANRLERLVRAETFKVGTGFAGTPLILLALEKHGKLPIAYSNDNVGALG